MSKFKVVRRFKDTDKKIYEVGDSYNVEGLDDKRIQTLSTKNNKYKQVYIEVVEESEGEQGDDTEKEIESVKEKAEYPKHTGGGYFELSNGEKVQGKDKAIEAEKAL